jgi:hypothetical protein
MTETLPQRYEVIRFKNGQEIVGMVRERESRGWVSKSGLEVWAPMTVSLTSMPNNSETIANFTPFTALAQEACLFFNEEDILFRALMNEEFINLYDAAATEWMGMIERKRIRPISQNTGQKRVKEFLDQAARNLAEEYLLDDEYMSDNKKAKEKRFKDRVLTEDDIIH